MKDSRERRFSVSDGQQTYVVHATQTHRPQPYSAEPTLEWQFYIEALNLILVQEGKRYVAIDEPNRAFVVMGSAVSTGLSDAGREAC